MVFSDRMVPELIQPFWAALQRGEFITDRPNTSVELDADRGRRSPCARSKLARPGASATDTGGRSNTIPSPGRTRLRTTTFPLNVGWHPASCQSLPSTWTEIEVACAASWYGSIRVRPSLDIDRRWAYTVCFGRIF